MEEKCPCFVSTLLSSITFDCVSEAFYKAFLSQVICFFYSLLIQRIKFFWQWTILKTKTQRNSKWTRLDFKQYVWVYIFCERKVFLFCVHSSFFHFLWLCKWSFLHSFSESGHLFLYSLLIQRIKYFFLSRLDFKEYEYRQCNHMPLTLLCFFVFVRVTYQQRPLHLIKLGSVGKTHKKAIAARILILNTAEAWSKHFIQVWRWNIKDGRWIQIHKNINA